MKKIQKAVLSLVLVVSLVTGIPAGAWAAQGTKSLSLKDYDALLSREAAAQGMVLLENKDSALPIPHDGTVALFGSGQIKFIKGGTGSGDVNVDYTVNLLQGMQNKQKEGKISLYQPLSDAYSAYLAGGGIGEMPLSDTQIQAAAENAQTAVVTISRISGEGSDRKAAAGDYYLSSDEITMLNQVTSAGFEKVAVVLNICGVIDTSWIRNYPGISVLISWLPGMEGGNAVADVLCGDVNPSGKLADTFAKSYDDYPSSTNFGQRGFYVNYEEDIYVGYRYFETFDSNYDKVNYEFGYGLSYTTFDLSDVTAVPEGDTMKVSATVTNTGSAAGKEVVQAYFSAPQGELGKPGKQLASFAKTDLLSPGESQTLDLSYAIDDMASYDDTGKVQKSAYVLEPGDYNVYVGDSIKNAGENGVSGTYTVDSLTVTKQLTEELAPQKLSKRLLADGSYEYLPTDTIQQVSASGATKIEAENFSDESTAVGQDPRVESYSASGGVTGKCLAYMNYTKNTVTYDLNMEKAGTYSIVFRASNGRAAINDMMNIYVDNVQQPNVTVALPQTGDGSGKGEWYNFVNCAPVNVTLPAGRCQLTLECKGNNLFGNLDYMTLTKIADPAATSAESDAQPEPGAASPAEKASALRAATALSPLMLLDVYNDPALMDAFVDQLSNAQLADLLQGKRTAVLGGTGGIGGLGDFGIPSAQTSDGPAGLRLTQHCTCWPCSTLQACTWDTDLVRRIGTAVGMEALQNGVDIWLAPGMNIHRDPLCGRNFEYYSEDPLIAGKMAAALTEGVQSKGVGVTLKHFACNDRETNRNSSDSRLSERALREIYLRGFQIAVTEASPWCIMTSYNLINGTETSESHDLLTDILRGEWGYTGMVMTDWGNNSVASNEVKAGNDVKMPSGDSSGILSAVDNGSLTREDLERDVKDVLNMIMKTNVFQTKIVNAVPTEIVSDSPTQIKATGYTLCSTGIGAETCQDIGGGANPTYTQSGAWLSYFIHADRGGSYALYPRVAGTSDHTGFDIYVDGIWAGSYEQPRTTGAYQTWVTGTAVPLYLASGDHTLKIAFNGSLNLNWFRIMPVSLSARNIVSVKACDDVYVPFGTAADELNVLPQTAAVTLNDADASSAALSVSWNTEAYDPSKAGVYAIRGTVILPDDGSITNINNLTASVRVHVLPKAAADRSALESALNQAGALSQSGYTASSWKALSSAVAAAKALPDDATQQQVNDAAQAILQAIRQLVKESTSSGGHSGSSGSSENSSSPSGSQQPSAPSFVSDTNTDVAVNGSYLVKITSRDGHIPSMVIGTAGPFDLSLALQNGNDYFFRLTAVGKAGERAGIYVDGQKLFVASVASSAATPAFTSDTTLPFTIKAGASYLIRITSKNPVTFVAGTANVFSVRLEKAAGDDWFFRIVAVGRAGDSSGFYVNSGKTPVTIARIS